MIRVLISIVVLAFGAGVWALSGDYDLREMAG